MLALKSPLFYTFLGNSSISVPTNESIKLLRSTLYGGLDEVFFSHL
jgi:hypothetical protein